jgi:hypothetical protein
MHFQPRTQLSRLSPNPDTPKKLGTLLASSRRHKQSESDTIVQEIVQEVARLVSEAAEGLFRDEVRRVREPTSHRVPVGCEIPDDSGAPLRCGMHQTDDTVYLQHAARDLREMMGQLRSSFDSMEGKHKSDMQNLLSELEDTKELLKAAEAKVLSERLYSRKLRTDLGRRASLRGPIMTSRSSSCRSHYTGPSGGHSRDSLFQGALTVRSMNTSRSRKNDTL